MITEKILGDYQRGSTYSMDTLDKWISHLSVGKNELVQDFIILLRIANNLKVVNGLFLEFSHNSFGPPLTIGN